MSEIEGGAPTAPEQEVVRICRDLLRIDTSNYGPGQDGPGEREAADYVVAQLREVGLEPQVFESEPGRTTVSVRIAGADRDRGALCIHLSLIHISEPTRRLRGSRMPSSA